MNDQAKIANGFADAFNLQQQPGSGIYAPTGSIYGPEVSSQNTLVYNLRNYFLSNNRAALSQAYTEIGLIETMIDVPVDDAFRGGLDIKSLEMDESDIEELTCYMEEMNDIGTAAQTCKWDRLYGAAATIVLDGNDAAAPFDMDEVPQGAVIEFKAVDLWELFSDRYLDDDSYMEPNIRSVTLDREYFTYYGKRIHKSRVMLMKGKTAPSFLRPRLRGWGVSVVEVFIRSLNQYLKATDLTFEVLDEFKVDVYRIDGLVNTLFGPNGAAAVQQRIAIANAQKSFQSAIVLDKNDEFDNKQLSFAGVAEVMGMIKSGIASDLRIPQTKLFGQSAAGFSSGEDDIENYNAMIESTIRQRYKYHYLKMIKIRCMELFGAVPADLSCAWKSLRVLKATDEEAVKTQKFARLLQARQAGEITSLEFREGVNQSNLFDMRLDNSDEQMQAIDEEQQQAPQLESAADDGKGTAPEADDRMLNALGLEQPLSTTAKKRLRRVLQLLGPNYGKTKMPAVYTAGKRLKRAVSNSVEFDRAAYEADGGDSWIDSRRSVFFDRCPVGGNQSLWDNATHRSIDVFGDVHWQFVCWFYAKMGGRIA